MLSAKPSKRPGPTGKRQNISWRGPLNHDLIALMSKEYHRYLAPPAGSNKKDICAGWAKALGINDNDVTGERVKQNVDKLVSSWKNANEKRNSTGFGDYLDAKGNTVTWQDQLLRLCEHYFELEPILSNQRTVASRGGSLETGIEEPLVIGPNSFNSIPSQAGSAAMTPTTGSTNYDPNVSSATNDLDHLSYPASCPNTLLTSAKAAANSGCHAPESGSNYIVPDEFCLVISPETSPSPEPSSSRRNRAKELRERYEAMESQAEDSNSDEDELDESSDDTYASPAPPPKKAKISRTRSIATVASGNIHATQLESAAQPTGAAKRTKGTRRGISNLKKRAPASGNLKGTPKARRGKAQYGNKLNEQAKAIADMLTAVSPILKSTLEIAKLQAESYLIQIRAEKEKECESQRHRLAHEANELKFRHEELAIRRLEAKARILQYSGHYDSE